MKDEIKKIIDSMNPRSIGNLKNRLIIENIDISLIDSKNGRNFSEKTYMFLKKL